MASPFAASVLDTSQLLNRSLDHNAKMKKKCDKVLFLILDSGCSEVLRRESFEFFRESASTYPGNSNITTGKNKVVGNGRKSSILQRNKNPNRFSQTSGIDNSSNSSINGFTGYLDIGDLIYKCKYCGALMWYDERTKKDRYPINLEFTLCCMNGKVQLPLLKLAPDLLTHLHKAEDDCNRNFLCNLRAYNMMFAFTSFGGKVDPLINQDSNPPIFKLGGQNHHYVGSLLLVPNESPKFAQLYIFDTDSEIKNRLKCFGFRYIDLRSGYMFSQGNKETRRKSGGGGRELW